MFYKIAYAYVFFLGVFVPLYVKCMHMYPLLLHYKCLCFGVKKLQFRYIFLVSASQLLKCSFSVSRGILRISFWNFLQVSDITSASVATRYTENPVRKVICGASFPAPTARFLQRLLLQILTEIKQRFDCDLQTINGK